MVARDPKPIGVVLQAVIDAAGWRKKFEEVTIMETWAALAGAPINAVTEKVWITKDRLHVRVRSAAWRHELTLQRGDWLARLNEELGRVRVTEIVFR